MVVIAVCVIVFGAVDLALQKRDFAKQSRMTYNERLEDDRLQEQPASLARELKQAADSLEGGLWRIREAAVLTRNPTHLVVGLAYSPSVDAPIGRAPRVICKGSGRYAAKLIDKAAFYGIPVQTNVALARSLYALPVDSEIPAELYAAVDALLAEVVSFERTSSSPIRARMRGGPHAVADVVRRFRMGDASGPVSEIIAVLVRILHARAK